MKITVGAGRVPVAKIAALCGGRILNIGYDGEDLPDVAYICTDSREVEAGSMLCAIRGERVDGHDYMASAHERGGRVFLCERVPDGMPAPCVCILIEDTVCGMGRLAAGYRETYLPDLYPVAITGSVGKTTTKECVAAVLARQTPVFKKEGNFNSTIGLPLTVMEMRPTARSDAPRVAVLEMGMSGYREIHAMSTSVHPRLAIITNIGHSHLERLGTRENIAAAKSEILDGMTAGDILLINGDEPLLDPTIARARAMGVTCLRVSAAPDATADICARPTGRRDGGTSFDITFAPDDRSDESGPVTWQDLFIPAPGTHMILNAAFAAAVGYLRGMTREAVADGLADYRAADMRQRIRRSHGITLIEDCYNAAPESMCAALDVLAQAQGRRIAVLGSMYELGEDEISLHRSVGEYAVSAGIDELITVGTLGAEIAQGAMQAGLPPERVWAAPEDVPPATVAAYINSHTREGDTLLFKASRAVHLERVIEAYKKISRTEY